MAKQSWNTETRYYVFDEDNNEVEEFTSSKDLQEWLQEAVEESEDEDYIKDYLTVIKGVKVNTTVTTNQPKPTPIAETPDFKAIVTLTE